MKQQNEKNLRRRINRGLNTVTIALVLALFAAFIAKPMVVPSNAHIETSESGVLLKIVNPPPYLVGSGDTVFRELFIKTQNGKQAEVLVCLQNCPGKSLTEFKRAEIRLGHYVTVSGWRYNGNRIYAESIEKSAPSL